MIDFDQWMEQVDEELIELVGLSSSEMPDIDYYTRFEEGISPHETARDAYIYLIDSYGIRDLWDRQMEHADEQ